MGFSRQGYWNALPCPAPGDLPNPGIKHGSLKSPALAGGFLTLAPPRKPPNPPNLVKNINLHESKLKQDKNKGLNNNSKTPLLTSYNKYFPFSQLVTRQGFTVSILLLNILPEALATAIRQDKEMKGTQIGKGNLKLFTDGMIAYVGKPEESTK